MQNKFLLILLGIFFIGMIHACSIEPVCGNNILESGEECDHGLLNGFLCWATYGDSCEYCSALCHIVIVQGDYCGDGVRDNCHEQCDDGNSINGDGCSSTCKIEEPEPTCGDQTCNGDETCLSCSVDCGACHVEPTCGDGEVNQISEQCDYGINNGIVCIASYGSSCEYCSALCHTVIVQGHYCGDGITNGDEQCDDGNTLSGDGCSSICKIEEQEPICGNNILESGEECDHGDDNGKKCDNSKDDCEYCSNSCNLIKLKEDNDKKVSTIGYNLVGDFCVNKWECSGWSKCYGNIRTRTCSDSNYCDSEYNKPVESTSCSLISNSLVSEEPKNNFLWVVFGIVIFVILLIILVNIPK